MSESGNYQGRHYTTYVEDVRALKRDIRVKGTHERGERGDAAK